MIDPLDSVAFLAPSEPRKSSMFLDRMRRPQKEDTETPYNHEGQTQTIN